MSDVRVLLTGAAGFIGSEVRRVLTGAGHEVIAVDALIPQAHAEKASAPGVHRLDVRDALRWRDLLRGVDVVCHQSALVGAGTSVADLPAYASHNDTGTAALLAAMAAAGVHRLVLASSMVVYGEGRYACGEHAGQQAPPREEADLARGSYDHACPVCRAPLTWQAVPEEARLDPRSAYAASKVAQEHYASAWARQAAGAAIALRYHNVYGPGMPRDSPYSGVAAIFRSHLARGDAPRVFEDGRQMRDFVHVADVARANLLAVAAVTGHPEGGLTPYNICSGTPIAILDVARALSAAVGGPEPVVTGEFRAGDVRHVVASPARAARDLGFTATTGPADGLPGFAAAPLR